MERKIGYGCVAVLLSGARVLALWHETMEDAMRGIERLRASAPDGFFVIEDKTPEPVSMAEARARHVCGF